MKHYRDDTTGMVYAFEDDGSQDAVIPPHLRQIDGDELTGILAPPIEINEARAAAIARVKAVAGQKILNRYPDWKQRNMTAHAVELLAAGAASGPEWEALSAAWVWIGAVRNASDRVEAAVMVATDQAGIEAAMADVAWPE